MLRVLWFGVACVLHLAVGYFYLLSGLVAPPWAVVGLLSIWIALMFTLIRIRSTGPKTLIVPAGAAAIWLAVLWAGDALLGWTA